MSSEINRRTEEAKNEQPEMVNVQYPLEATEQAEAEKMKFKLANAKNINPLGIGISFIAAGILSLALSVFYNSQVLAFIGLGLTFWGALFLFVRPIQYVKGTLLDSTIASTYLTVDRIVKDLKLRGKGYYIPPYPKDVYLPDHLKGLKDMVVFISAESAATMPPFEDIAESRFLLDNSKGVLINPPGLGLLTEFEKELRIDITKIELKELCENLSRLVPEYFQIAKEINLKAEGKEVTLQIVDPVYKDLYTMENLKSVHFLGCPIASAVACAIAKTTGKPVTIQKDKISPDGQIIEVQYRILEG